MNSFRLVAAAIVATALGLSLAACSKTPGHPASTAATSTVRPAAVASAAAGPTATVNPVYLGLMCSTADDGLTLMDRGEDVPALSHYLDAATDALQTGVPELVQRGRRMGTPSEAASGERAELVALIAYCQVHDPAALPDQ